MSVGSEIARIDGAGARIIAVAPMSPADDAGFYPGCRILKVEGHRLRDILDWRWYASEETVEVTYLDLEGDTGTVELQRDYGQDWGLEFEGAIFDEIVQCRNACTFCFMRQLPEDMRGSLTLRDDDYRLSFTQGTFVTLTNVSDEDAQRILEQRLSPLRYSLHAITPTVRAGLIGKHAARGIEVAEQLLAGGIQMHAQIVLLPDVNDGDELMSTLSWAYDHPGIVDVGIVPIGFTKHQSVFSKSFNDVDDARRVIDCVKEFQDRALQQRGKPWVLAADEFYRNAFPDTLLDQLPPTSFYGDFELFEDGIGIVRSFIDDWQGCEDRQIEAAQALRDAQTVCHFVCGCAQREFFAPLVQRSPLAGLLLPLFVNNDYFGGNVDVTGLLCGCDIVSACSGIDKRKRSIVVIPDVIFNDDGLTLDDMTIEDMRKASGMELRVVSCNASEFLPQIAHIVREHKD